MSVRNAEQTIALAIRSILRQSFARWELILIDDGSTDGTLDYVRSLDDPRIHVVADGENRGLASRLNQAIVMARGKYIARMDADDVSCPERIARQVAFLEDRPETDLVGTGAIVFVGDGEVVGSFPVRQTHEEICSSPWSVFLLAHPTWMGKRDWFLRYQYRVSARRAQDQDLLLRAHESSRYACLPDVLLGYRQSDPTIRNIVLGRYHYSAAIWRYARETRRWGLAVRGLLTQLWRGSIGVMLVAAGQGNRLLSRRFGGMRGKEANDWRRCWSALRKDD